MKKTDLAVSALRGGFNCAQAVCTAFCEELGLNKEAGARAACALGAGMSRTAKVCGAVSGALMVIGLRHGSSKSGEEEKKVKSYAAGKEFLQWFESKYGSINCPELINVDISTDEGLKKSREMKLFETICVDLVKDVVQQLEK
jgi:C_GCAxxG_C_C family probable redox protein